jgi:hypothetical protein
MTHQPRPRTLAGAPPLAPPVVLRERRPDARRVPGTAPDEHGITTAEYAVGTAAGAGLAGLLYQLLTSDFGERLLRALFEHVLRLLGIG